LTTHCAGDTPLSMRKPKRSPKERYNAETGLKQVSVWLNDADVQTLREIGKRPDVDREWSWLARKAIREYIERDKQLQAKEQRS
jgi:hypothetical protein